VKASAKSTHDDQYWSVVEACLKRFHGMSSTRARRLAGDARQEVERERNKDFFYHAEPFDIACDLARADLDIDDVRKEYVELRDRVFFPETATRPRKRA
jgi:hypothetical protein